MTFAPASTNEPPCFLGNYPNVPPCSVRVPNVPPVSTTITPVWGITCTSIRSRTRYTELESIRITPEAQQGSLPAILKEAWIKGKFKQVRKLCAFLYSHHLHVVLSTDSLAPSTLESLPYVVSSSCVAFAMMPMFLFKGPRPPRMLYPTPFLPCLSVSIRNY